MYKFRDWQNIPPPVYDKALSEIKDLHSDLVDDVISTTNKSIQLLIVFSAFFVAAGQYILDLNGFQCVNLILLIFAIINWVRIYTVIKPRVYHSKGLYADESILEEHESKEIADEQKLRIFYKNALDLYQIKVSEMEESNRLRAKKYANNLFLSAILIGLIVIYAAMLKLYLI